MSHSLDDVTTRAEPGSRKRVDTTLTRIPTLTIMAHPRMDRIGEVAVLHRLLDGQSVELSRNDPDFAPPGKRLGRALADPFLSRKPLAFALSRDGAVRLCRGDCSTPVMAGGTPFREQITFSADQVKAGVCLALADRVVLWLHLSRAMIAPEADDLGMVGSGDGIREVRRKIRRVADLDVPILIRGETGTGKELAARAIFAGSQRAKKPFLCVNLGAIPKDLAAAELFGNRKGAFTGADQNRAGYFRSAHRGVLFLDELGEASAEVQVMLLRVLETGEVFPVGSQNPVKVNVRFIAATDAKLEELIEMGRFKAPLLHRLAGAELHLPPLRERREDIGRLFYAFAKRELAGVRGVDFLHPSDPYADPWLPAELAYGLMRYSWPGNIRELANTVRELVIDNRGNNQLRPGSRLKKLLEPSAPPRFPQGELTNTPEAEAEPMLPRVADRQVGGKRGDRRKPADISAGELVAALRLSRWNLKATADHLRISRPSVYELIEKCPGLRTARDLKIEEIETSFRRHKGDTEAMVGELEVSKRALCRRLKELGLVSKR